MIKRETHTINAEGKALGRIAVEAVLFLRGKDKQDFMPNKDAGDFVIVRNLSKVKFSGKKLEQKKFYHHSGYPGGIKETTLQKEFAQNSEKVLKRAVFGMLPKNKLRAEQVKRLKIQE